MSVLYYGRVPFLTVGLQCPRLAATAASLIDGLDHKDVLSATLQAVHGIVVLFYVGHDHPAVQRVAQAWDRDKHTPALRVQLSH